MTGMALSNINHDGLILAQVDHTRAQGGVNGFSIENNTHATITDSAVRFTTGVYTSTQGAFRVRLTDFTDTSPINPPVLVMERDVASQNNTGVVAEAVGTAIVSESTITDNFQGVAPSMFGTVASRGNNTLIDNDTNGAFTATSPPPD